MKLTNEKNFIYVFFGEPRILTLGLFFILKENKFAG